mgnify:FL=1
MASRFTAPTPPPAPPLPPVSAAVKEDLHPQRRINRGLRTTVKTGLTGVQEAGVQEAGVLGRPSASAGAVPARKLLLGE